MKTKVIAFVSILLSIATVSNAGPWHTKNSSSKVSFDFPAQRINASMSALELDMNWVDSNISRSTLSGIIRVNTLRAGDDMEENYLRKDVFNVTDYSAIYFVSTSIKQDSLGNYSIVGQLEIRGHKKEVHFPFTFDRTENAGTVTASFDIHASDFNMYPAPPANKNYKDKITISFAIPVKKQ